MSAKSILPNTKQALDTADHWQPLQIENKSSEPGLVDTIPLDPHDRIPGNVVLRGDLRGSVNTKILSVRGNLSGFHDKSLKGIVVSFPEFGMAEDKSKAALDQTGPYLLRGTMMKATTVFPVGTDRC